MTEFATGTGYSFKTDIDQLLAVPTDTPDFEELCPTTVDRSLNEAIDTFFRLCDEGFAQNILTGIDGQYDITVKGDKNDTALIAVLDAEFDIDARNRAVIEITDNFRTANNTITAGVSITALSDTRESETVIEFSMTFKFRGKPAVTTVP
jgi:hypothetical protein